MRIAEESDDDRARSALGTAYTGFGRRREAVRAGQMALDMCPVSRDTVVGSIRLLDLALMETKVGALDDALDRIEQLLSTPNFYSPQMLRLDPRWAPLHGHPRYESMIRQA